MAQLGATGFSSKTAHLCGGWAVLAINPVWASVFCSSQSLRVFPGAAGAWVFARGTILRIGMTSFQPYSFGKAVTGSFSLEDTAVWRKELLGKTSSNFSLALHWMAFSSVVSSLPAETVPYCLTRPSSILPSVFCPGFWHYRLIYFLSFWFKIPRWCSFYLKPLDILNMIKDCRSFIT